MRHCQEFTPEQVVLSDMESICYTFKYNFLISNENNLCLHCKHRQFVAQNHIRRKPISSFKMFLAGDWTNHPPPHTNKTQQSTLLGAAS